MSLVRFGILGLGHIGRRHAAALAGITGVELTATIDPSATPLAGVPHFKGIDEWLAADSLPCDIVSICTPNGLHASHALQLLQAGLHVVVEKPVALRFTDAQDMMLQAERSGRKLFPVLQTRLSPAMQWLHGIVRDGRLGELILVQVQGFWNRNADYYEPDGWHGTRELDGGILFTQFAHYIDTLHWLFGAFEVKAAQLGRLGHSSPQGFEDTAVVQLAFDRGGLGSLAFTTAAWERNQGSGMTLLGSRGLVEISGPYLDRVVRYAGDDMSAPPEHGGLSPEDYHRLMLQQVVDALGGNPQSVATAAEAAETVRLIELIYHKAIHTAS